MPTWWRSSMQLWCFWPTGSRTFWKTSPKSSLSWRPPWRSSCCPWPAWWSRGAVGGVGSCFSSCKWLRWPFFIYPWIFHILYFILYQVALAAGLEEAGVIGRMAAKERAEEAMKNLQESARILQVSLDQSKSSRGPIVILKHHRSGGTWHEGGGAGASCCCFRLVGKVWRVNMPPASFVGKQVEIWQEPWEIF